MGGAALLQAIGDRGGDVYHMNEGHSALLTLQLLERQLDGRQHFELDDADLEAVRQRCIFTTHTPVPAGHDKFPIEMVRHVLGDERVALLEGCGGVHEGMLNMTHLALQPDALRQRRGDAAPRRVARDVPRVPDQLDHQRRARGDVDRRRSSRRCSTGACPSGGATICTCATPWASRSRRSARRTRRASARCSTRSRGAPGQQLDPNGDDDRLRAPRDAVQARGPDLHRPRPARRRSRARSESSRSCYGGKAHPHDGGGKDLIRRIYERARAARRPGEGRLPRELRDGVRGA